MKIIKLVPSERKIGLSIRALKSDEFRTDWEEYAEQDGLRRDDARRSLQGEGVKPRAARGVGAPQAKRRGAGRGAPATKQWTKTKQPQLSAEA